MSSPRVSVITIFFNGERFLAEAIESVLAQTYRSWELLLVDDGSTDGSGRIAQAYVARYPDQLRYVQQPGGQNYGMSAARNRGLQFARGEYVAFLDADDVWLPGKLERQVAILDKHEDAMMVFGPTQWWYSWPGNQEAEPDFVSELGVQADEVIPPPDVLRSFLAREDVAPCTCSVLVRRDAVEEVGGFEQSFRAMYEDQAFFAKICAKFPVFASSECLAKYRRHAGSSCSLDWRSGQHGMSRARFLAWLDTYLRTAGVEDTGLKAVLEAERQHAAEGAPSSDARGAFTRAIRRTAQRLRLRSKRLPVVRHLRCLRFRRFEPLGGGRQVGTPIVRHYWAEFLKEHRADVRGRALEIGTTSTVRRYGGAAVTQADALDLTAHSAEITLVSDLSRADDVPSETYDCFVNQFTTHVIYDLDAALYHSLRILKSGGVLLVNFPCVDYYFPRGLDMGTGAPMFVYWWFTPIQVQNLLRRAGLTTDDYRLRIYGNLFTRIAYQLNMPAEELTRAELAHADPGHPLLICARISKPSTWDVPRPEYRWPWTPELTATRWNPERGHYG